MTFQLYNTLTRQMEEVTPMIPPTVRIYVCGPTIYNRAHIGNFRTYLAVDLLRRALQSFDYSIEHVMNFTDVDDKTIRGAQSAGVSLQEFTTPYRQAFNEDLEKLHIQLPDQQPNATDHIDAMIDLVKRLMDQGFAYQSEDGTVYYAIEKFPTYGKLSHLQRDQLQAGARVRQDEYQKEGVGDFALWKAWSADDGPLGWDSPWGRGRPGWHLECSAMSMKYLGETFDLHAGGEDLCFPHHENEIAQSEAATGKPLARYWFHVAHLQVDGHKMSKSLGNLYTVEDVQARGYSGRDLRYALLGAHYRQNLNFTWKGLDDARQNLERIDAWKKRFRTETSQPSSPTSLERNTQFLHAFRAALAHDLNVPEALGQLFLFIRETNRAMDAQEAIGDLEAIWKQIDSVLGLGEVTLEIPSEIQTLLNNRALARKEKNYARSDEIREAIAQLGWHLKDTPQGQEVSPLSR